MVPLEVDQWYSRRQKQILEIDKLAGHAVRHYCDQEGFAYASRRKTLASLAEKLETGRTAALADVDDLFACSIIIPSLAQEESVVARLTKMFQCITVRKRHETNKYPDVFRFEATRFVGRLIVEDARLAAIPFEIQVRTAFEHAWSVATHGPAYKGETIDWKLERLAAQMKAIVEQLDNMAVAYYESAAPIVEHPNPRTDCELQVLEHFQRHRSDTTIPTECFPENMGYFSKNVVSLAEAAEWGRRRPLEDRIKELLNAADAETITLGLRRFPRSISLFQFVLGSAVEREIIPPKLRSHGYFPPISSALEEFYPKTRDVQPRCVLSEDASPSQQH